MIVALNAAVFVAHNEEYGCSALVFRSGEGGVEPVKTRQHHFQTCLAGKRAGLKVYNSVEHLGLGGGEHLFCCLLVLPFNAVCHLNEALFHKSGYVAAGVVVSSIDNAHSAGVVNKLVAVKAVTQRSVVMLAFSDKIKLSVLADAI